MQHRDARTDIAPDAYATRQQGWGVTPTVLNGGPLGRGVGGAEGSEVLGHSTKRIARGCV